MAEPVMKGKVEQRNINTIVAPIIDSYNKSGKKQNEEYKYILTIYKMTGSFMFPVIFYKKTAAVIPSQFFILNFMRLPHQL
jgi:hypothetical protein